MDETEQGILLQLETSEWIGKEADKLIAQYHKCKTAHAKNRLRKKLEYMKGRLMMEHRALSKLIGDDTYGNETIQ